MPKLKKAAEELRNKAIPIKFSTLDLIKIKETARREHLHISTWIRKKILESLD